VAACMILLHILQASLMLPNVFAYMSTKLFPTMTSDLQPLRMICWWTCALQSSSHSASFPCLLMFLNPGTFHLPTSSNPDQVDQPCSLYIPRMNAVTRTERKLHTDLLISKRIFSQSILHLLTFSILPLLSHQCKGSDKNSCQSLDHGRIATKRDQATRHISKGYGSIDMWMDVWVLPFVFYLLHSELNGALQQLLPGMVQLRVHTHT
jgi:hypothetical protein